jgi:transcription termination/antitermination protein NusA
MPAQTPRTEFAQALKAVANERGLDVEVILETMRQAIAAAWRRDRREHGEETEHLEVEAVMHPVTGETQVFAWPLEKPEEKQEVTPPGFGRIAAQTAKQVIHQKIREAEKESIMDEFSGRVGGLISGMILRFDGPNVRVDLGKTEGLMPAEERIPNERLSLNQRLSFLLKSIEDTPRGKIITLSRADGEFVRKLFEREVPEISSGSVEIKAVAREAGVRSKIAVFSSQSGVDPVGSCVGQKGVRVQTVTNELGGERIDIISFSEDAKELIKASLSPVEVVSVELDPDTQTAKVTVGEHQLSLAIGKEGQNVRLVKKLTGWNIDIVGAETEESKAAKAANEARDAEIEAAAALKEEPEVQESVSTEAVAETSEAESEPEVQNE